MCLLFKPKVIEVSTRPTLNMNLTAPSVFVAIFLILYENSTSIKILRLDVPQYNQIGLKVYLCCAWELGPGEKLYSIKWYKDGKEFYRYVPGDIQSHKMFLLEGVRVEKFDSTGANIVLSSATLETEGRYRCEVSGERPHFLTVSKYANLTVVVLPNQGPVITKLRRSYKVGDRIQVNCTSGRSRPRTTLSWYINNVPAYAQYVLESKYINYKDDLSTTKLTLDFQINDGFDVNTDLKLKCLASVPYLYWKSNEVISTVIKRPTYSYNTPKYSLQNRKNMTYSNTNSVGNTRYCKPSQALQFFIIIILVLFYKIN